MKNPIFVTFNLSAPRKASQNLFNNVVFNMKMKDPGLHKLRKTTLVALFSLILKNEAALITDSAHLLKHFNINEMGKYLETYGMQNYYFKLEIQKAKESLYQSIVLLYRKVPGSTRDV